MNFLYVARVTYSSDAKAPQIHSDITLRKRTLLPGRPQGITPDSRGFKGIKSGNQEPVAGPHGRGKRSLHGNLSPFTAGFMCPVCVPHEGRHLRKKKMLWQWFYAFAARHYRA